MLDEKNHDEGDEGLNAVPLMDGINGAENVLRLFLQNHFKEATSTAESLSTTSMYHAVAYGTMLHLQATATLERSDLEKATTQIKYAVKMCLKHRRKSKFSDNFAKSTVKQKAAFYAAYTDDQAHAELCYAESLLQWVFLAVLQDEKLVTLIKSSLKLRECYKCYRTCWKIYKNKQWGDSPARPAFECGVLMGVGAFNLLLSMLPTKVLSLLEIVGFSGNKELGLKLLHEGRKFDHAVRDPLCALILLVHDLYATQMIGDTACDPLGEEVAALAEARSILPEWTQKCPNSAYFLFLQGRLELLCGEFEKSRDYFFQSIGCQADFINYHHICYWELMWCHCVQSQWLNAKGYAEKLACESKWSQATYRYLMAAFIIEFMDDQMRSGVSNVGSSQLSQFEQSEAAPLTVDPSMDMDGGSMAQHVEKLLKGVPGMLQRIAGKSLPIEKFAMKKSIRYFEQGNRLTLPGIELMYLWNGFKIICDKPELVNKLLLLIENKIQTIVANEATMKNFADDFCLATMLKGVCLRCLKKNLQAKMCFTEVLMNEKHITLDKHVLPFSNVELCQIAMEEGEIDEAKKHLEKAWTYTKYSLEARLHFRLHSLTSQLKAKKTALKIGRSHDPSPVPSWPGDLDKAAGTNGGDDDPFNLQFTPKIDNMDDGSLKFELYDMDK